MMKFRELPAFRRRVCLALSLVVAVLASTGTLARAEYSRLWGKAGELWDPRGRLPDYSYAGYHAGEVGLPTVAVVTNVKNHGAKGDGQTDDTDAFKKAIAATQKGAILIPKGRYVLRDILNVNKSNIVLRGEGSGANDTVLFFPRSGSDITGSINPWQYGANGMVWVGARSGSAVGSNLGKVTSPAVRGDTKITVSSVAGISAGQYVVLRFPDTKALTTYLMNGNLDALCTTRIDWPVKVVAVSGNAITLQQPLRFDIRSGWYPDVSRYTPVQEVGIEDLRIEFPDIKYPGHHMEVGYNALAFRGALNCWGRNLVFLNAENGPSFETATKHCTLINTRNEGRRLRDDFNNVGHHGYAFNDNAHDCLLTDFYCMEHVHDVTVQASASGNVTRRGSGEALAFDHHKRVPFENLFTDTHMGGGNQTRAYASSGTLDCGEASTGVRETFWGLTSRVWAYAPTPPTDWPITNTVPGYRDIIDIKGNQWAEKLDALEPADLYTAQLKRRGFNALEGDRGGGDRGPVTMPNQGGTGGGGGMSGGAGASGSAGAGGVGVEPVGGTAGIEPVGGEGGEPPDDDGGGGEGGGGDGIGGSGVGDDDGDGGGTASGGCTIGARSARVAHAGTALVAVLTLIPAFVRRRRRNERRLGRG